MGRPLRERRYPRVPDAAGAGRSGPGHQRKPLRDRQIAVSAFRDHWDIVAQRQIDDHRVVRAFRGIVLLELGAEAPGLASDNRVYLGVVVRASAEYSNSDSGLLQ